MSTNLFVHYTIFVIITLYKGHPVTSLNNRVSVSRYSLAHMIPEPAYPGPILNQFYIFEIKSLIECGAICKAKQGCLGYSYVRKACSLYREVLYAEDLTDNPDHQLVYYDILRITHPYDCPEDVSNLSNVGKIKLSIIGHGPLKWREGRQITFILEPQQGACNDSQYAFPLYEYEYYDNSYFNVDYGGRSSNVPCSGFELFDYDDKGLNTADSRQSLKLGSQSGLFHIHIDVDMARVGYEKDPVNLAMWGYQLEFISRTDATLLYTMTIPQYSFGRGIRKRSIGRFDSDVSIFSCDVNLA